MTFKTRFIMLAIFNAILMLAFFYLVSEIKIDSGKRLIDLNLENIIDRQAFFVFIGTILIAFVGNFIALSIGTNAVGTSQLTKSQVREIAALLRV